jgi:hypothetical protein
MIITFKLSNRRFIHKNVKGSNDRRLIFDAVVTPDIDLEVVDKGRLLHGTVHIHEGNPPENEFGTLSYHPACEFDGQTKPHCFQTVAHIPAETFHYLLSLDMKLTIINLSIAFDKLDCNFKFGGLDPDDNDIYWDTTKKPFEITESVELVTRDQYMEE